MDFVDANNFLIYITNISFTFVDQYQLYLEWINRYNSSSPLS